MTDNSSMNESGKSKGMTVLGMSIIFLVLLAAGLIAMHALIGQKLPSEIAMALENASDGLRIATWDDLKGLQDKCTEVLKIDSKINELRRKLDPGRKPKVWSPIKLINWHIAYKEWKEANKIIDDLTNNKNAIITVTKGLAANPERVDAIVKMAGPVRLFWNGVCSPILHLLLALTLVRYGLGLLIRMMLVNGLVHKTHL